ncbi:hypothetical protein OIU84_029067 [Salix udensis]|uniref:Uncharacterized protein n=1 Tax=Salix udensis TaxID=889485 RepID=A0AAD6P978_9ROSI|nr:hypothetical protein OIU84_029067 [Salix udensis]
MCAARRIPFSPGIVPHEKERARAPAPTRRSANVKRGVEPESANRRCFRNHTSYSLTRVQSSWNAQPQMNVSCYTKSPPAIGGPSGKAMICEGNGSLILPLGTVHERQLQSVTHPPPTSLFRWHRRDPA